MALSIVENGRDHANDFRALEELGSTIYKTAALLRAAHETEDRDDESWLVSIALKEIEDGETHYMKWARPDQERGA